MLLSLLQLVASAVAFNGQTCDQTSLLQHNLHERMNVSTTADTRVAMEPVLRCLRLTTPNIQTLKNPNDADEHFETLRKVLSPWFDWDISGKLGHHPYHCAEGYCGPWLENHWIQSFFESTWENRTKDSKIFLADIFGPFIPIFMPYADLFMADKLEWEDDSHLAEKSAARCCLYHGGPTRRRTGVQPWPSDEQGGDDAYHGAHSQCVGFE